METKQSRYSKKVARVELTINPETEANVIAALEALSKLYGGKNPAIKAAILLAAKQPSP